MKKKKGTPAGRWWWKENWDEREREKKRKAVPLPRTKEVDATEKSACFFGKKRTERTSIGEKKIFQAGDFTIWGPVAYGGPTHVLSMAGLATSPSSTTSISLTTFSTLQPLTKSWTDPWARLAVFLLDSLPVHVFCLSFTTRATSDRMHQISNILRFARDISPLCT